MPTEPHLSGKTPAIPVVGEGAAVALALPSQMPSAVPEGLDAAGPPLLDAPVSAHPPGIALPESPLPLGSAQQGTPDAIRG